MHSPPKKKHLNSNGKACDFHVYPIFSPFFISMFRCCVTRAFCAQSTGTSLTDVTIGLYLNRISAVDENNEVHIHFVKNAKQKTKKKIKKTISLNFKLNFSRTKFKLAALAF